MGINISYQPAAGDVAGLALLGGQGQYAQGVNQLLTQQWGQVAQLNNARMIAMQQAAAEAQRQASAQNFQMQMAPVQSYLSDQSDARHQMLSASIGADASQRDFQEQQQLYAQQAQQQSENEAARIAQQQQGQLYNQQAMASFNQDQQAVQQFQSDPFAAMRENQQQSQQKGYDYSPDQQMRMQTAKKNLMAMQDGIQSGQHTIATLLPDIKSNMAVLSSISANPDIAPPPSLQDQFSKDVLWANQADQSQPYSQAPAPGYVPMQKDPKSGAWQVIRGWKPPEPGEVGEDGILISGKAAGQNIKNQQMQSKNNMAGYEWAAKMLQAEDPGGMMRIQNPEWAQQRMQELVAIHAQMNPGLAKPVHEDPRAQAQPQGPAGQPPAAGINPQNPQGMQPQAGQAAPQAAPQQPQAAPQLPNLPPLPHHEIPHAEAYLKSIPQQDWTRDDVDLAIRLRMAMMQLGRAA